jgi:putative amino-acid transport system substrate-binding protein
MKRMLDKGLFAIMAVLLLLALSACNNSENASAENEGKVLKVGSTGLVYPFSFKEGEKLQGFDIEVVEKIADKLGYEIDWQLTDFSGLMGQLESGKLDTVANQVAVTAVREEKFNFSEAYAYDGTQIIVKNDNNDIKSVEDLKGKKVASVLGSNHAANLEGLDFANEIDIKTYEAHDGMLNELDFGRIDAYANGKNILLAEIEKSGLPLKAVGDPISKERVAFPFVKDDKNDELIEAFNQALAELREDGTLKELSEKYFKEDVTVEKVSN